MSGSRAAVTKVVGSRDEARAEVLLPDAIDDDSRRPRVVRRCDLSRELQAAVVDGSWFAESQ